MGSEERPRRLHLDHRVWRNDRWQFNISECSLRFVLRNLESVSSLFQRGTCSVDAIDGNLIIRMTFEPALYFSSPAHTSVRRSPLECRIVKGFDGIEGDPAQITRPQGS